MKIAIYPGSFDPISNGHVDIIKRASKLFDKLIVLVSLNPQKKYVLTDEERVETVKKSCAQFKNVEIVASKSLVLDFAKKAAKTILTVDLPEPPLEDVTETTLPE